MKGVEVVDEYSGGRWKIIQGFPLNNKQMLPSRKCLQVIKEAIQSKPVSSGDRNINEEI